MTGAGFVLLAYICAAPADGSRVMACRATEVHAPSCATALAIAEAGLRPDRTLFAAACIVAIIPDLDAVSSPPRLRPTQARRQ